MFRCRCHQPYPENWAFQPVGPPRSVRIAERPNVVPVVPRPAPRSDSLARDGEAEMPGSSPPLVRTFLVYVGVGAVLLVAVASVAVFVSVRVGRDQALRQPVAGGEVVANDIVAPLVTQGVYTGNTQDLRALDRRVLLRKAGSEIERVKVWSADGTILYSDDPRLIGLHYALDPARSRAMTSQAVESTVADLSRADDVYDRSFGESLDVYAGARDTSGRPILVETYYTVDRLDADGAALIHQIAAVVLGSLLALGLLLIPLAYSLARRVSRVSATTRFEGPGIC